MIPVSPVTAVVALPPISTLPMDYPKLLPSGRYEYRRLLPLYEPFPFWHHLSFPDPFSISPAVPLFGEFLYSSPFPAQRLYRLDFFLSANDNSDHVEIASSVFAFRSLPAPLRISAKYRLHSARPQLPPKSVSHLRIQ